MARARNIKPAIMDNEELAELSPLSRLLFIYLWMLADREGRIEDRPKRIAAQALPYDRDADVNAMLNELSNSGFITRYVSNGVACIQINAFTKHQTPHIRETASTLPVQESSTVKEVHSTTLGSDEAPPRSPDSLIPDSPSLIPDSKPSAQEALLDTSLEAFDEFWATYPNRPGSSKADSLKAWKTRIKEGAEPSALIEGAAKYAAYCLAAVTEPKFIKQPATFLGPGQHYLSDWTAPAHRAPPAYQSIHDKRAETIAILTGKKSNERTSNAEHDITGESVRVA